MALTGGTLNDASFSSQTANYVKLGKYSADLNAAAVTFDGKTGGSATIAESFAVEDKVYHAMDALTSGRVTWAASAVFVTPNTLGLQRGIVVASSGDTVHVQGGSYAGVPTRRRVART